MVAAKIPNTTSGSIMFENISSTKVLEWPVILTSRKLNKWTGGKII